MTELNRRMAHVTGRFWRNMSKFAPWTDDEAEKWAKEYAHEATSLNPQTDYHLLKFRIAKSCFLAGLAKAAAQIDKCETIYYRDSDHEERVIVASPECFELDTHEAKLVGVRSRKETRNERRNRSYI